MIEKNCKNCGKVFSPKNPKKDYCSNYCAIRARYLRKKERSNYELECVVC